MASTQDSGTTAHPGGPFGDAKRFGEFSHAMLGTMEALVIVLDRSGRAVFFNKACERLTGWTLSDLGHRPFWDVLIPAAERELVRATFHALASGASPVMHENSWLSSTGQIRWIAWANSCLLDAQGEVEYILGTGIDITRRREAEQALQRSEEKYRLIVETTHEGVWTIDAGNCTTFVNPRMAAMLGYQVAEMMGQSLFSFMDDEGRRICLANIERRRQGIAEDHDFKFLSKVGAAVWTRMETSPLFDTSGRYSGALALVSDTTERRRIEAQIQQAEKLESLGVLAGGVAHDFNNLLMAIMGNIELAEVSTSPLSPVRDYLDAAASAAKRATDLCKQMLAYSGHGQLVVEPVNLNDLLRHMTRMIETSISKKATLIADYASALPSIDADTALLQQVVMNLVLNASEALGDRKGDITLSTGFQQCDRAYLQSAWLKEELPEGLYVSLDVADTGCGLEPATVARIFDPFYSTKFTGRGLGLAAVLGIVRGHKGAIRVQSEPGRGSCFRLLFPARLLPADVPEVADSSAMPLWRGTGRILLIDDEPSIVLIGRRMLEALGFEVVTAEVGRAAVDCFREQPGSWKCVLLDMLMPDMDGGEVLAELQGIDPAVKVILSSGHSEDYLRRRFTGRGVAGILQKPYQLRELAEKLRKTIGDGQRVSP